MNEVELVEDGSRAVDFAKEFRIVDAEGFQHAGKVLLDIKARAKAVVEFWKPMKQAADAAKKQLLEKESAMLKPYQTAQDIIGKACSDWDAEQRKRAADERRKLEEAAKAEAEARRAAQIEEAEQYGTPEEVAALVEAPVAPVVVAPAESMVTKVKGLSFRTLWRCEVTDAAKVPAEYMVPDLALIGKVVKAHEGKIEIPGVRVWSEQTTVGRT